MAAINPCIRCGAGETDVRANKYWTGQRHTILNVEIVHWCDPVFRGHKDTQHIKRETQDEAIAAWNEFNPQQ